MTCGRTTVYPRERGGDRSWRWKCVSVMGLSPRTRGRLHHRLLAAESRGSIPANAGETSTTWCVPATRGVYPRERGGDDEGAGQRPNVQGLSPRTRGRPTGVGQSGERSGVYPRERGGDSQAPAGAVRTAGLSPRTRGRLAPQSRSAAGSGSIPANAGETRCCIPTSPTLRVYPRERGGDRWSSSARCKSTGLSPRTRGRPGSCIRHPA